MLGWKADTEEMRAVVSRLGGAGVSDRFGVAPLPRAALSLRAAPNGGKHIIIRDQQDTSGCVGFSVSGAARARLHFLGYSVGLFSAIAPYGIGRQLEGKIGRVGDKLEDTGSHPYLVMEGVSRFGLPPEEVCPFDNDYRERIEREVDFDVFQKASQFRIANFSRIAVPRYDRVEWIKRALASNTPVPFGTIVGDETQGWGPDRPPVSGKPETGDTGGHMMFLCGYESVGVGTAKKTVFHVANSWGTAYGDDGFVLFSEEKIIAPQSSDFYCFTITDQSNAEDS